MNKTWDFIDDFFRVENSNSCVYLIYGVVPPLSLHHPLYGTPDDIK